MNHADDGFPYHWKTEAIVRFIRLLWQRRGPKWFSIVADEHSVSLKVWCAQ